MKDPVFKVVDIVEVTQPMLENGEGNILEEQQNIILKGEHVILDEANGTGGSEASSNATDSVESDLSAEEDRGSWGGKMEFIFTCVGYAVGLGNVWRFPYLCYKNGGGAFLIPYCIMLAVVGLPLFYLELAFGQFGGVGPITIWRVNPLLKGLGYSMVMVSWLICLYYNVIISHVLFYLFASMRSVLPWTTCGNAWNTNSCLTFNFSAGEPELHGRLPNESFNTPAEEYYKFYVLEQSKEVDEIGSLNWKLALCLLAAWVIVGICLIRGVQSLGKVVYFTAIFPYFMLTILLIRGLTLDGAVDGIIYYLKPNFSRLGDPRVWSDAATQIFYSLSACSGGLITMSSFNKFRNNCYRDSLIVALINCATSIYSGFVIFSILGFMAKEKGVAVSDVAKGGPGLAFEVYPEAIARMPVAPLWAVFFFLMMATLGFGSQFSIVECVMSSYLDEFRDFLRTKKASIIFRISVCVVSFLLGLPMVCNGGIYLLNLVDFSVGGFPLLVVGFCELLALSWVYGFDRFSEDIEMMLGKKPNIYWKVCWKYVSPIVILVTIVFNIVLYKEPDLEGQGYPSGYLALGWIIVISSVILIPVWFLLKFCKDGGFQMVKDMMSPLPEWGPSKKEYRYGNYGVAPDGHFVQNTFTADGYAKANAQWLNPQIIFGSNTSTSTMHTELTNATPFSSKQSIITTPNSSKQFLTLQNISMV
ncbi:sodium- and chloride-dependent glycine transporter 1-like [Gigantopelta aegis]|uniref:sodium- and chloride-dependent glycine transporter 1-like n=1 Tax=Gigantopelta aegis TaxID=1735272 RepID=UPI001B889445|nr:sodium- and chloride-dependent glycine transporter 1-like [Gigantopelta aegis]